MFNVFEFEFDFFDEEILNYESQCDKVKLVFDVVEVMFDEYVEKWE